MTAKKQIIPISLLIILILNVNLFALSPAVKSKRDYVFTLSLLRQLRIMVENFADDEMKSKHKDVKKQFEKATQEFYSQNFKESGLKYKKLKQDLIILMENVSNLYLQRTKEILDSTANETFDTETNETLFDILIKYSKNSDLATYFKKPYDPLRGVKAHDPNKYHYFHDKVKFESYLREGYKKYQIAKRIYNDPDLAILKKKQNKTMQSINNIIKNYTKITSLCREAKECGIEIYRVKNINQMGDILKKYDITHGTIFPVYDERIPEKFRKDANDNLELIHSIEMKRLTKNTPK